MLAIIYSRTEKEPRSRPIISAILIIFRACVDFSASVVKGSNGVKSVGENEGTRLRCYTNKYKNTRIRKLSDNAIH